MEKNAANVSKKIKRDEEGSDIRTRLVDGYEDPDRISSKDNPENEYVPDVVSQTEEKTDLYEIELDERNYLLEKWRSYNRYLKGSGGTFSIVTPKQNLDVLKEYLKLNRIKARLIYFSL